VSLPRLTLLLLATALPLAAQTQAADTILFHGNILTGAHLRPDDASPTPARVTALAIQNGRILAIGTDDQILALKLPGTRLIDLHGAFALPGFNDAHTHMAYAGKQKLSLDLDHTPSLAAMLDTIQTYAATRLPGTWLQGGGWDQTLWPNKQLPTRQDLDRVTAGHPTFLWRTDGHMAIANSAALAAANITDQTPDPPGARIDRDPNGLPTGILRETAATNVVQSRIPPPSPGDRRQALDLAIADALAHGVTSVQDFSDWDDFLTLVTMEHTGHLKLRVSEWIDFTLPLDVLKARRASHPANDPLLHLGMLKGFMDGSLGSRTAAMEDPYADDPANSGIPRFDQEKLNQMSSVRAAAGFQLGFHAIGDRANEMALNALTAAEQVATSTRPIVLSHEPGSTLSPEAQRQMLTAPLDSMPLDTRFRIEHAQVLLPEDFSRFHDEHIIASMQPSHLLTDMNWAAARLGPQRTAYAYAWKSFLDHNVTLAFGTDYPVESISPFRGLYAAVTRQNEAGTATFHPEQRLTIQQALYAYTQASAYADFSEHLKGRLEPGFLADIAVLDRDLLTIPPRDILATQVLLTLVNGEVVYTAPPAPAAPGQSH
jgi:predicted amidohydrolase YtcJ